MRLPLQIAFCQFWWIFRTCTIFDREQVRSFVIFIVLQAYPFLCYDI